MPNSEKKLNAVIVINTREGDNLDQLKSMVAVINHEKDVYKRQVYGYIALSVLIRIQCSRVDVDIRVKLLNGYIITSCL